MRNRLFQEHQHVFEPEPVAFVRSPERPAPESSQAERNRLKLRRLSHMKWKRRIVMLVIAVVSFVVGMHWK